MSKEVQPILDPEYWNGRYAKALTSGEDFHKSIFICRKDVWERIEKQHKKVLKKCINKDDSILDVGCGYGRLLTLLPSKWRGEYKGIDLCPRFIDLAKINHPERANSFYVENVEQLTEEVRYDWAIMISFRPMIIRNLGSEVWDKYQQKIYKVSKRVLFLEYSEDDNGTFI